MDVYKRLTEVLTQGISQLKEPELQYEAAKRLIHEINSDISDLSELNPLFLLDMMAVCGLEFNTGLSASNALLSIMADETKVK